MQLIYKTFNSVIILAIVFSFLPCKKSDSLIEKYPIIPTPQEINYGETELFFEAVSISGGFQSGILKLKKFFKNNGIDSSANGIKIEFVQKNISEDNNEEAYKLSIDEHIAILASTEKGAYYGIQTLKQLLRKNNKH